MVDEPSHFGLADGSTSCGIRAASSDIGRCPASLPAPFLSAHIGEKTDVPAIKSWNSLELAAEKVDLGPTEQS